ncbi:MAG: DUF1552 domain-containing protein [Aeoliella sp.]
MSFKPIPRRTFLRGVGATVALPWLDGMTPIARAGEVATDSGAPPTRLAFFYAPNGMHMPDWLPTEVGKSFELPSILQPLESVREHLLVLSGLAVHTARANGDGAGDHARSAAAFLTGMQPVKTDGRDIRAGVSVDQIAAKYLGRDTRFPSLELGCEAGALAGKCDSGYSCAYSNSVSWRSPSQPAGKEVNPKLLFDRMFGKGTESELAESSYRRRARQESVLDFIADDARRLQRRLGQTDRRKMDQYLDGIREVERRIDDPTSQFGDDGVQRPRGIPMDFGEHARLMGDLLVLAFQADLTRVSTFMVANEGSNNKYTELDLREGHHSLSHHQFDEKKMAVISRINRYHVEQFAYILGKMAEIKEGEGSLLDHSAVVYGSALADGNRHDHHDLPILVAGSAGGRIETGRHQAFPKETPLMNLFLALLKQSDVPVESIGDSTEALKLT